MFVSVPAAASMWNTGGNHDLDLGGPPMMPARPSTRPVIRDRTARIVDAERPFVRSGGIGRTAPSS